MEKKQAVQILRAGAAVGVMVYHLLQVSTSRFGTWASFGPGSWGVDVFFVISGFVIAASGLRVRSPVTFLQHRFARVIPLYWLLTFAVFIVAVVAPSALNSTVSDPGQLLKSLFFIPFRKNSGLIEPTLYQGWTLNYEMFFYISFGVVMMLTRRTLGVLFVFFILTTTLGAIFKPQSVPLAFYTSSIVLEFTYGLALYQLTSGGRRVSVGQWTLLPLGLVALCISYYCFPMWPRCVSAGIPAATIVAGALAIPNSRSLALRWAEAVGDASYSVYLVHAFAVTGAALIANELFGISHPNLALLCMMAIAVPGTIVSSLALYRFFEKPMNLWLTGKAPLPQFRSPNLPIVRRRQSDQP